MEKTNKDVISLEGPKGILPIKADDKPAVLLAMLFEGKCLGLGGIKAAKKYGYSKQRYFQLLNAFKQGGLEAITPKKTGPKGNSVRTKSLVTQIVRHRFLDPDATAEVIAQKMRQTGYKISIRSVERTITDIRGAKKNSTNFDRKRKNRKLNYILPKSVAIPSKSIPFRWNVAFDRCWQRKYLVPMWGCGYLFLSIYDLAHGIC